MQELGFKSFRDFQAWSAMNREAFWTRTVEDLGIRLRKPFEQILDLSPGIESAQWLCGAELNIAESCFSAELDSVAVIQQREGCEIQSFTVRDLNHLSNRVAGGLVACGHAAGDAVAIHMPMNVEAVVAYIGIIKMGGVVVSIADSFAAPEIATRLRLGNAKAVITQECTLRAGRELRIYDKLKEAMAPPAVVVSSGDSGSDLRDGDISWHDFLSVDHDFDPVTCTPDTPMNVLFSSGTTGDPKAIPWTHVSPIKCVSDAFYLQDIRQGEVVAWPTNLGWMMGPWLIFAALVNRATIAIYDGAPSCASFGRFVQDAKVQMLGVIPSLVTRWRTTRCMEPFDWSHIRRFSSTGECSNADDMSYLMELAGGKPVIEYCGGTELAGGYIGSSMMLPCAPASFNTIAPGMGAVILDDAGRPASSGELFLVPPSIGFSTELLNSDHHEVYYAGTPDGPDGETLRRHGDRLDVSEDGFYRAHGRMDDTMNLGGIKVGSAEIERVLNTVPGVSETAAIAVPPPEGGPDRLVVYTVLDPDSAGEGMDILETMRALVRSDLNPLFNIHDVVLIDALPRTASNKVMRRELRARYDKASLEETEQLTEDGQKKC
jgi:acetyl-CoA synthetase